MKMNKKGKEKLRKFADVFYWAAETGGPEDCDFAVNSFEIEADDFVDCVALTSEEAKEISFHLYKLAYLYSMQVLELDPNKEFIKPLAKTYEMLNGKICQAIKTKINAQLEGKE